MTSGVAMGVSEALGGDPTLTAVLVMITGVIGVILVTPMMDLLRIRDMRARGFAAGLAATASAPPAPFRSARSPGPSEVSRWGSTPS